MDDRILDLYKLSDREKSHEMYLMDMREQCAGMERRVFEILEKLSTEDRQIVEAYLDIRNELEFQSVKAALKFSKHVK